jgi:putative addiction module component (TIGR02574 family)
LSFNFYVMNLREEISKLSTSEKILLVEEIWDDIATQRLNELTDTQRDELRRRSKLVEEGKMEYYTMEQSLAMLKSRKKDVSD